MSDRPQEWHPDFVVFAENGELAAVAEAKKKPNIDARWATEWFRNYSSREGATIAPFVLLVTPEKLYVWKRPANRVPEPTAVADSSGPLSTYLDRTNVGAADVSGRTFEFVVGAWLNDLSHHLWQPSRPEEVRAFVDTGLLKAIENGRVVADLAA